LLDEDLAALYGVATWGLVQAVHRNRPRFPDDFMFQLSEEEFARLRSQVGSSNPGCGGQRYRPYAFTRTGCRDAIERATERACGADEHRNDAGLCLVPAAARFP